MIPTAVPNIGPLEAENLSECVTSTMVSTMGPFVTEMEENLTRLVGAAGAVSTASGTSALHAALHQIGVSHGDLVIIPSLTFIATANAVSATGASPWLFDCSHQHWTLDIGLVRKALVEETIPHADGRLHVESGRIVKAIMPVMVMGVNPDFFGLEQLRREFGIPIVVDAAAAVGAVTENGPLGSLDVDALCFSFNGNKTITCGGGGAIVSRSADLIAALRHLTTTGRVGRDYDHDIIAFNYRMTNVNAAIGVAQLKRLSGFLKKKAEIQTLYNTLAQDHDVLCSFPLGNGDQSTHWLSGVWYNGEDTTIPDQFRAHMREAGVDLRKFWKPIHLQTPYVDCISTPMHVCNDLWQRVFPLPCSTNISNQELEQVMSSARRFWNGVTT